MRRKIAGKTPEQIRALSSTEVADPVTQEDLEGAITRISPSVSKARPGRLAPRPHVRRREEKRGGHASLQLRRSMSRGVGRRRTAKSTRSGWLSSAPHEVAVEELESGMYALGALTGSPRVR
jgi:hypothetical protein